jgi:hypothetical protein
MFRPFCRAQEIQNFIFVFKNKFLMKIHFGCIPNCDAFSVVPSIVNAGNTERENITVPLTSCLTGLDRTVLQIKTKIVRCHTADSKAVKQEVNGTVILPPLVFPGQ